MNIEIQPVRSDREMEIFVRFPWRIYRNDPYWVPPLLDSRRERLDLRRNSFWKTGERELWIAWRDSLPLGTVGAFLPRSSSSDGLGSFGFFEAIQDRDVACRLLDTAANWLRARGAGGMRGPFNPSPNDEPGILVEGFQTRPAVMEGHAPPYYRAFFEQEGFERFSDMLARIALIPPGAASEEEVMPPRMLAVARRAALRPDLRVRGVDIARWDEEMKLVCDLYNDSLVHIEDFVPVPYEEFAQIAEGFRPILSPDLALVAEIGGKAVGFVLAIPDVNEALQGLNGRLGLVNLLRLWWGARRLKRVSFKILVILPEVQGRGVEAVLIQELTRSIIKRGFREVDMSLTGDDNPKSSLLQEHLGFQIYRRYRIYHKELAHGPIQPPSPG